MFQQIIKYCHERFEHQKRLQSNKGSQSHFTALEEFKNWLEKSPATWVLHNLKMSNHVFYIRRRSPTSALLSKTEPDRSDHMAKVFRLALVPNPEHEELQSTQPRQLLQEEAGVLRSGEAFQIHRVCELAVNSGSWKDQQLTSAELPVPLKVITGSLVLR